MRKTIVAVATCLALGSFTACEVPEEDGKGSDNDSSQSQTEGKSKKKVKGDSEPDMTQSQENALKSAENYLEIMAFSKAGLIKQLSSSAGDGFSKADATFAVNNVDADWKAEAVEAAKGYQEIMPMSRAGLIDQLSSPAGDQFTKAEAEYAADKIGL